MHVLSGISSLHVWCPSYRSRGGVRDKRHRLQSDGEVFALGESVQGALKGVLDTREGVKVNHEASETHARFDLNAAVTVTVF